MFLSMRSFYTNSYSECNTCSYSTCDDSKTHNQQMEYKDWLLAQLAAINATPTDLSRAIEGDELNQPTIQRIIRGTTKNPRIGTAALIEKALKTLGSKNPKYSHDGYIDSTYSRIDDSLATEQKPALPLPFPAPEKAGMSELIELANQLDTLRMGMLIKEARNLLAEQPTKQTLPFTG